jgi:hypothetical protein
MAQKTNPNNSYQGVKNAVKSTQKPQQPEEPRITPGQVITAFHSFGFTPNERNMNDIGYWTTKGQSEGTKLIEELRKRRADINGKIDSDKAETDAQNKAKQTLPRLSDNDIKNLHDEYGLPSPDPEWVRNNMSNDPTKVRAILDMQRKTSDDMLKKHMKNQVNSIPEVPKGGSPSVTSTAVMPPNNNTQAPGSMGVGQGGPGYYGMGGPGMPGGITPMPGVGGGQDQQQTNPFFIGDHALVRIVNPNNPNSGTLFLVDAKNKTLHPFTSDKAFQNTFEDPEAAKQSITTLSSQALAPGGPLAGFQPLGAQHGVGEDGTFKKPQFTTAQIQQHYGKPSDPASEQKALSMLDSVIGKISPQLGNLAQQNPQNQAMNANS